MGGREKDMPHIINTFEEHGEALSFFAKNNYKNEVLLYFDQHFDFKYIPPEKVNKVETSKADFDALANLNRNIPFAEDTHSAYGLDNFLYIAAKLGYIKKLIWVIPEVSPLSVEDIAHYILKIISLIPYAAKTFINTFKVTQTGVQAKIGILDIEFTTLRRLKYLDISSISKVDIDLDYFYNIHGQCLTDIDDFLVKMQELNLLPAIHTLTYSISSGFLPQQYRWLSTRISKALSAHLEHSSRPLHGASASMETLALGKEITTKGFNELYNTELEHLKGPGEVVKGLLSLQMLNLSGAMQAYEQAIELGDRATSLAYKIGLYFYNQKSFHESSLWFLRAQGDLSDTMHLHSLTMQALAHAHASDYENCLNLCLKAIDLTPLRLQNYNLGLFACKKLGLKMPTINLENQFQKINHFYNKIV
mgnify:CR=1 FL=1